MRLEVLSVRDYPSPEVHALHLVAAAILFHAHTMKEGFRHMANDFTGLKAALAAVEDGIRSVAAAIANPAVDKNDQTTIDGLTAQLTAAADALAAATAAENAEDAGPVVAPAPTPAPVSDGSGGTVAPTDGTGSTDVTP